nr:hypothetical protein [Tanacetum cinerariifolium]
MAQPIRTDDQILPHIRWVPIGKSNYYLDGENLQSNPIYKIAVDILKHTNFFRAFTASSTIPSIYIQQDALQITPAINDQAFTSPPSSNALINFVNELGYPKLIRNLSNVITNDMLQPWRALTTIINLCVMGKTYGFERPRAPVLQILRGIVNRAHLDYAERICEEFTQSIHTFIKDKRNLAQHTHRKKKATLIVIPNIQGASYYREYLAKVANHQRYLAGETRSDPDSPTPKPTKTTKKSKPTAPKADPRPLVSKPASSKQPEPKPAPAKTQGKKRKLTTEIFNKPSKAKKSKPGSVSKRRKPISSLRSVDESVAEDVPKKEPWVDDFLIPSHYFLSLEQAMSNPLFFDQPRPPDKVKHEPTISGIKSIRLIKREIVKRIPTSSYRVLLLQSHAMKAVPVGNIITNLRETTSWREIVSLTVLVKLESFTALEESLKSMYDVPRGPLPPVGIREPDFEKYQPLPETPKKKSPVDRYIFKRRTSTHTGSSGHDESSSLYVELRLMDSEEESKEDVPGVDAGVQGEGQAGPDLVLKMKARLDQTLMNKLKARLDQTLVILEEPASSSGTLSSLQHLTKDLSFGDLFFSEKPSKADNEKANAETEAESMVSVMIQQDASSILPMTTPIIDLTSRPESPKVCQLLKATAIETTITTTIILPPSSQQQQNTTDAMMMKRVSELEHIMANLIQENKRLEQRLDSHRVRLYILEKLDIPHQVSKAADEVVTDAVDWAMQAPLQNRFRDLPEADMREILHQRMWETDSYKTHKDHMQLHEALEKSMNRDHSEELAKDLAEARKKKKKRRDSPKTPPGSLPHQPPPPPPPAGLSEASGSPEAFGSSQVPPPPPPPPSTNQEGQSKGSATPSSSKTAASAEYQAWTTTDTRLRPSISMTPADLQMDDDMALDAKAQSSDDENIENAHIPKVYLRQDWWKPLEEKRPATLEPAWSIPSFDVRASTNNWASALVSTCSSPPEDSLLMHNVSKPLPLGSLPDQVTIQSDFFFNKDLEYLRYGSKGSRYTLSTSKMKAAYYLDVGLEKMVFDQMWIEEECKYDIAAMYGISHWWFQRQRFYIDRHTSEGDRRAIKTHMRILSVIIIEVFSMYGAVTFWDRYGVQMIMRFNKIHKFSDGTLQQIDKALDYQVKEFKINRMNPGLNTRF